VIEFIKAKTVKKAYANSVNPLPRVYNPGILTNIETKRTIHQAIVTSVRNIPTLTYKVLKILIFRRDLTTARLYGDGAISGSISLPSKRVRSVATSSLSSLGTGRS
jgi:hypothetical protein